MNEVAFPKPAPAASGPRATVKTGAARYKAGVLKYAQMGYWEPDYTPSDTDILALHRVGSGGLLPDMTILLEGRAAIVADRLARRDGGEHDRIGGRDSAFHRKVAAAFRRFAEAEPERFVRIDSSGPREETHQAVVDALGSLLGQAA